ncbi:MAG: dienelactone hydrolase family protein [Planctomycetota bacterium]
MSHVISDFRQKFSEADKSFGDITHPVWSGGNGLPIILMHELDGFTRPFMHLAIRLSERFTVHAPVFYGQVGEAFSGRTGFVRAYFCMRSEFEVFRLGRTSPIAGWIRDLAADVHDQAPSVKGVGVVGMCMTGGIVLATISHASVAVGVAAQPSLPLMVPFGSQRRKEDIGMNADDIQAAAHSGTPVLTLRYGNDRICPAERLPSISRQIPTANGPPDPLEDKLKDKVSHPTLTDFFREGTKTDIQSVSDQAINHVISFLSEHLN